MKEIPEIKIEDKKEKEDAPVIVEIGPSGFPVAEYFKGSVLKKIEEGASYVGIDIDEDLLKEKDRIEKSIVGDLSNLPLKDESVDEFWLMNVFGGLKFFPNKENKRTIYGAAGSIEELSRTLRPGGRIVIGELYCPISGHGGTDWLKDSNYDKLGLAKKVYIGKRVNDFFTEEGMHDAVEAGVSEVEEGPFIVVLYKPK